MEQGPFLAISSERMLAHDGVMYWIGQDGVLKSYTVATKQQEQVASLAAYDLAQPSLAYAAGNVLVYDEEMGVRLFVTAVAVEETGRAARNARQRGRVYPAIPGRRRGGGDRLQQRLIDLKYLVDEADGIMARSPKKPWSSCRAIWVCRKTAWPAWNSRRKFSPLRFPRSTCTIRWKTATGVPTCARCSSACAISSIWPTRRTASLARARKTR